MPALANRPDLGKAVLPGPNRLWELSDEHLDPTMMGGSQYHSTNHSQVSFRQDVASDPLHGQRGYSEASSKS